MMKLMKVLIIFSLGLGVGFISSQYDPTPDRLYWYALGYRDGYNEGVISCPCWEREGNVCSLCGTALEGTGQFKRIR